MGLISKIYKQLIQLNNKQPNQKMGRRPKYTCLQRRHIDGQPHMKRCSTSLIIREMQVNTTIRYHLTLVRMIIIKKSTNSKCWRVCKEKVILLHCLWEYPLEEPLWKTVWRFLKKLELSYDPAIPLLGVYPNKTIIQKIQALLCS